MQKQISDQDKIDFYKTYSSPDFQKKLTNIKDKYFKIEVSTIKIFIIVLIIGMFFTPWMFLGAIPAFASPFLINHFAATKIKKEIETINPNISYLDFVNMKNSGCLQIIDNNSVNTTTCKEKRKKIRPNYKPDFDMFKGDREYEVEHNHDLFL